MRQGANENASTGTLTYHASRITIFSTQGIHFEFENRDGHGNLPGFQDLGVEFTDQS